MFYVQISSGRAIAWATERPAHFKDEVWQTRQDWKSFEVATLVANDLTQLGKGAFVAVDNGSNVSPRYDVIKMLQVGDDVSYGFNGDYYPCGNITHISPSLSVITVTDGTKFYRRGLTGAWKHNQVWTLVKGIHNDKNPEF